MTKLYQVIVGGLLIQMLGLIDPSCTLKDICPHVDETTKTSPRYRPPNSYMTNLKLKQMAEQGLVGEASAYEEDHIVPICLCGDTKDPKNLTPEAWPAARHKDVYEARFHKAVCQGKMKLGDAQTLIVGFE